MNAGTFNNNPLENTVPPWLLPCTCGQQRRHCNAIFKPNILCVKRLPYQSPPLTKPNENLTIRVMEFTYCNDSIPDETIIRKIKKYKPQIDNIINKGWKVDPLIVITASARATTHTPFYEKYLNNI